MKIVSDHPRKPVAALCKRHAQLPQGKEPKPPSTWRGHPACFLLITATFLSLPAQAQIDTQELGMSDIWQRHFNNGDLFDPQNPDHAPHADPDGDGWTNLQESIAGTDPFSGMPPQGMIATLISYLKDQQEAPSPEYPEGRIIDVAVISWDTLPGKQYTLYFSPNLKAESWLAADTAYEGDGNPAAVSITLNDSEGITPDKLFWRVHIHDPQMDTDGDGLTDYEEYLLGSNPYNADTSGDGVPDGWLVVHGYNPNAHHEGIMFGGSGVSVPAAFAMGVQAHPNATPEDLDGDGVPNELDAVPDDPEIKWLPAPEVQYTLIELPQVPSGGTGNLYAQSLSENGHILVKDKQYGPENYYVARLGDTSWGGPLQLKMNGLDIKQFSEALSVDSMGRIYGRAYVYEELVNTNIFYWAPLVWQSIEHEAIPIGNDAALKPPMVQGGIYTPIDFDEVPLAQISEGILKLAPDDALLYQPRSAIYPPDLEDAGPPQMKFGGQDIGYIENNFEYWPLSWEDVQGICYSSVSQPGAGGIAAAALQANGASTLYFIENGQRELVDTLEDGFEPSDVARMPNHAGEEGNRTFAIIGSYPYEGRHELWIRDENGWFKSSNHNVSGYAINRQGVMLLEGNQLWRNGRTHSLQDLCPSLNEYAGYTVLELKDNGQILVTVTEQSGKVKPVILIPVTLISDLSNDGEIDQQDIVLNSASYADDASISDIENGTEYMFHNDTMSNGTWDVEDDDPLKPENHKEDDDAQEIQLHVGITNGEVWLDHPAIHGISFYKTKECKEEDKIGLHPEDRFHISPENPLPERVYARVDGQLNYPNQNPQKEGDLKLMIKPSEDGEVVEGARMKLTIVKTFGANKFFHAAQDYILENNTPIFVSSKKYDASSEVLITVMRESNTIMRALDTYHRTPKLYGIDSVVTAYPNATVIINGNFTFDRQNIGGNLELTRRCHGRLVSNSVFNVQTSSDNEDENNPPPGFFGTPHPLRGDEKAGPDGKYISMSEDESFTFAKGRVILDPMPKEALGGLSTNYAIQNPDQFVGIAEINGEDRILFTVTCKLTTSGVTQQVAADAKQSGVEHLPGGMAHELNLFKFDGGSSLALSHAGPDGNLRTPIKGSKHTGRFFNNYCVHTYLMFRSEKPRQNE